MLVFRTNSSYARWVEARALWAVLVNSGRNIVRMALASFPCESKQAGTTIRNYTPGSKRDAESNRTTSESGVAKELQDVLQPAEITLVEEAQHRPNLVLQLMSRCVYSAKGLDGSARVAIDTEIKQLQDALGGCERILHNPIPLSYTRHTARFLIIWLFLLPLALWEKMHWGVVPATIVVSYLLFGIDEIAIQMEEPFSVLPLEVLCDGLQRDVKEMLDSEDRVQSAVENYLGSWGETGQVPEGWENPPPLTMSDTDMDSDSESSTPVPGEGQNVQQGTLTPA
ncbi:Bestrophin, RFP-TM, chloride channel-domain-containing protein [Dunaliella salina]|uniref:Bestrophin, RFP-TM, chloride channel-domain-containing protein n=1 Tax=Dunaliella salina TaxID=3046 RepID=A0ABQ7GTI3_DUNSA|nr:Bestrophin, RFP-TM, chloride channel-domain-containing protein [Dunaliella salina]|eukprot:KAF5837900.1 Bestrophin, RFP-TM, chloride channel-domain-containing protein [Dunaliella salina]